LQQCQRGSSVANKLDTFISSPSVATVTPTFSELPPPATSSSKSSKTPAGNTISTSLAMSSCRTTSICSSPNQTGQDYPPPFQVIKQRFSRTRSEEFVWEPRYHDFNVFTAAKKVEKLRYMHRNPVKAGLVDQPDEWQWSSFRAYAHNDDHPILITTQ
jgi:hypothetical protein